MYTCGIEQLCSCSKLTNFDQESQKHFICSILIFGFFLNKISCLSLNHDLGTVLSLITKSLLCKLSFTVKKNRSLDKFEYLKTLIRSYNMNLHSKIRFLKRKWEFLDLYT